MIVNPQILNELRISAGSAREERAENYVYSKKVSIKKVIYDKDMDYSFTHNMRDGPI